MHLFANFKTDPKLVLSIDWRSVLMFGLKACYVCTIGVQIVIIFDHIG